MKRSPTRKEVGGVQGRSRKSCPRERKVGGKGSWEGPNSRPKSCGARKRTAIAEGPREVALTHENRDQ